MSATTTAEKPSTRLPQERFLEIKRRNDEFVETHEHRINKGEFLRVASEWFKDVALLCAEMEALQRENAKLRSVIED